MTSVVLSIAAIAAIVAAALVALRMRGSQADALLDEVVRILRHEEDHPHWELLAQ